jgi:DNA-binding SARP family transcriptional activator
MDSEDSQVFEELSAKLASLECGNHANAQAALLFNLKLADWATKLLAQYLAEKTSLEARVRALESRYKSIARELTEIVVELQESPQQPRFPLQETSMDPAPDPVFPLVVTMEKPMVDQKPDEPSWRARQRCSDNGAGDAASYQFSVTMLGQFSIRDSGGRVVAPPGGKAGQILKYLLVHGRQNVPREVLMDRFWARHDPESARNNLNVAVYGLRKAMKRAYLDKPCITFHEGGYQMDPDMPVWVDLDAFNAHISRARVLESQNDREAAFHEYERAAHLYQGEFLPDDLYEEWTADIRRDLRDKYTGMCRYMADFAITKGDFKAAIKLTSELLHIDPCDEAAHRQVMLVYTKTGQRHLALRQYKLCCESLMKELGVKPEQETTTLYENIRKGLVPPQ